MQAKDIRPLDDRVVIEPSEADQKSPGGIVIPDAAREKPVTGRVLAVGPGRLLDDGRRAPIEVKVGDLVWFGRYGGADVEIDRKTYKTVSESELLAKAEA